MEYSFDFMSVLGSWDRLLAGAWLTVKLSTLAMALGFIVGTACAAGRLSRIGWLRRLVGAYVETIRNTPLLVQVFIVFFGLASMGLTLSAETSALITLVINIGAYTTEIVRAGIQSIHRGQIEAAECLALSKTQIFFHVMLLPAIERVYPALSSQFVLLMLASSITSQISVEELTATANLIQSETFRSFEVFGVIAAMYLALSVLFRIGFWALGQIAFTRRRKLGTSI
jgi:polar amino acid transport system permease protein